MTVDDHGQLFQPEHYTIPPAPRAAASSDLTTALGLDRKPQLIEDQPGLWTRRVAVHSSDKAHYAVYYADIVGTGMRRAYPGPLAWVELFAGPGRLWVDGEDRYRDGSPVEALRIRHPFDLYFFADLDPRCVTSLQHRVGGPSNVHIHQGNANAAELHDHVLQAIPRDALMVLYLDPQGLDLDFQTIRFFAERYKHLDLLLNVPVPGAVRALAAGHQEKASRMLNHPAPVELIGPYSGRASVSVREWFERQLEGLGYNQFVSQPIKLQSNNTPLYDLMLASREPTAKKFFNEAIRRGPGGQYALDLGI